MDAKKAMILLKPLSSIRVRSQFDELLAQISLEVTPVEEYPLRFGEPTQYVDSTLEKVEGPAEEEQGAERQADLPNTTTEGEGVIRINHSSI
jgi:hypothetical protein